MHSRTIGFRRVTMLAATVVVAVSGLGATRADAATTTTTLPAAEILNGVTVSAATVTTPGSSDTRHFNVAETAVFMRSWLPASIFQHLANEKAPKCLPISTVRFKIAFEGVALPATVYYASDGISAWVGMPAQDLGFASVQTEKWIRAPEAQATIDAFNAPGNVPSTTNNCASTGTKPPKTNSDDSSDSPTWLLFAVPAAIIVAVGVWLLLRSRSRARAA